MLTKKQRELLLFINKRMNEEGVAPSFEEMKEALGLKSKSGIHRLISALVERGFIERLPHRARALEIKKLPDDFEQTANNNNMRLHDSEASAYESIPLYGSIAAGTPIEAIRNEVSHIDLPPSLLSSGEHYALEVKGDSMINAGIHDQDIVVIKRADTAENGTIVVALIDGEEVTLKRIRQSGNKIILEPENDAHEPRVLDPERVQVQGKLASLIRQYH